MRRAALRLLPLLLVAPVLAGCLQADRPGAIMTPPPAGGAASLFSIPIDIPDSGSASEPHVAVDSEGRIFVSAPRGLPSGSPLFISEDGGATWRAIEPNPVPLGGGDTSVAIGPSDEVYLTDLWAGNSVMLVSTDHGATWRTSPVGSPVPYHDREWNTVDSKGVAYYLGRTFFPGVAAWVSKSTDGGRTWTHAGNPWNRALQDEAQQGIQDGAFFVNPRTDALAVVYTCSDGRTVCLSTSADQGATWKAVVAAKAQGRVTNIFPAATADHAGTWYVAYAAREGEDTQVWMAHSADGASWSQPVQVTQGPGVRLFPWMVAGDAGHVALAWYGTDARGENNDPADMEGARWHAYVAASHDALAASPTFRVDRVSPEPIQEGTVSTGGLGGDADRSLGDFFSIALDPEGRVHVAYARNLGGGETTLVHTRQVAGEPLLGGHPRHAADAPAPAAASLPLPLP